MKKLFAVIGDPIGHSMSPFMHNLWFKKHNIDAHYHALQVKKTNLHDAIKGLKAIGIGGFNVTVPHKTEIIPLLDEIDPLAEAIGAVNTVVFQEGRLIGYNTDGKGYIEGLQSNFPLHNHINVLMVGAGGAARAIYYTMASQGITRIDIANRTLEKVEELREQCPYSVSTKALSVKEAEKYLYDYDLIVQTTSIGMSPNVECSSISLHNLKTNAFVSDIIYNPLETQFLKDAQNKGVQTQNGLNMFIYQGALAFEKWTGIFPNTTQMNKVLLKQLGGTIC